jgi:hypothetical protein
MAKEYVKQYKAHCHNCDWYSKYANSIQEAQALLQKHNHKYRIVEYYGADAGQSRTAKNTTK